ncbi:hypothetical protein MCAV_01790 [[Mycoplasma] cavipharyngis]|uniref:hypothetical protein n=1 Tax=[Mycoplasma] cavipharyngis TaxID=92757 RepID=UPI00370379F3
MLKAFIIEFNDVFIHLEYHKTKAWKKVFAKIDPEFKLSNALIKKLITLNTSNQKLIFWQEFQNKCAQLYPKIAELPKLVLLKFYDQSLLEVLNQEISEEFINPHFLLELQRLYQVFDITSYLYNCSQLTNWIWEKLNLAKKYPFIKLCFSIPKEYQTKYLEDHFIRFDSSQDILDWASQYQLRYNQIVVIAKNSHLIKTAFEANIYTVAIDNLTSNCYSHISFQNWKEEIDFDQICFGFHAKD